MSYDKNGNISSIFRSGFPSGNYEIAIDNLQFTNQGKQLAKVSDTSNNKAGFKDGNTIGDDYSYDANGNMTIDKNKGITKIVYNHLNLPVLIEFNNSSTKKITYLYNANGVKVRKWVWNSDYIPIRTDYLDGFQYKNELLQYFPTAEGYVNNTVISGVNTYKYVYNYTDHLGNVRLSYQDINKDGVVANSEILEESNYYPFGMKHSGYNSGNLQPNYKYKYNGKELQDELGLNMYDYGARNYDPALGRWMNVDPLAEKFPSMSPYCYVANNPINAIDPDGREIIYVIYNKDGSAKEELKYRNGNFYHNRGEGKRYNPGKESLSPNMYKVLSAYRKIEKSNDKELKSMLSTLADSKQTHYVTQGETNQNDVTSQIYPENSLKNYEASQDVKNGNPVDTLTHYDFSEESKKDFESQEGVPDSDFSTVVHEMRHQYDYDQGNMADSRNKSSNKSPAEKRAVDSENRARKIDNLPKRITYGGKEFDID